MRHSSSFVFFVAVLARSWAPPLSALDPALIRLVGPDVTVLAGIDVDQAKASPFGQYLLQQSQKDEEGFKKLTEATGFDPRRDLREILMASAGGQNSGLVLVRGTFDVARIMSLAKTAGAAPESYQGIDVLAGKTPKSGWLAFLDASTAVAGDEQNVRAAIDRRRGGAGPNTALAARAIEWSAKADAWAVSLGSPKEWGGKVKTPAGGTAINPDLLEAIEQSAGGIKFGPTVLISAEALVRSDKDATALVDVLRFLVGLTQLNRQQPGAAEVAALLDTLKFDVTGRTVKVSLSVTEGQLEGLFKPHSKRHVHPQRTTAVL